MGKHKEVKEAARVCLQSFAAGIMTGYRRRIFEAIDKRIKEVGMTTMERYISGLEEAKRIIGKLE